MRAPLLAALAGLIALAAPCAVRAESMFDHMVSKKCAAAMQSDFATAGKVPAPGLIDQTCTCVVQQLKVTNNLEAAKTVCTPQAKAGA